MPRKKSMKSIFLEIPKGNSSPEVTSKELEIPHLDKNGVLVQVRACALTNPRTLDGIPFGQFLKKTNNMSHWVGVGLDVAGIVVAVGEEVLSFSNGDHIVGILPMDYEQSGCSEFVVFQEFDIVLMPENVSFIDAAGTVGDAVKAYIALHYLGRLKSEDTVLVLQGASSFGSICCQLAYHWGAKVLATSASEDEKRYLENQQPEMCHIVDLNHGNSLKTLVMLESGNMGSDIVVDQGFSQFPQNTFVGIDDNNKLLNSLPTKHEIISCLAVGGRWISSKANLQLDPPNSRLLFLRCASLGFLFEHAWMMSNSQQGKYQHILMDIMEKLSSKIIRPNVHHTVAFDEVSEAVKHMDEVKIGKVVMTM